MAGYDNLSLGLVTSKAAEQDSTTTFQVDWRESRVVVGEFIQGIVRQARRIAKEEVGNAQGLAFAHMQQELFDNLKQGLTVGLPLRVMSSITEDSAKMSLHDFIMKAADAVGLLGSLHTSYRERASLNNQLVRLRAISPYLGNQEILLQFGPTNEGLKRITRIGLIADQNPKI